MDKKIPESDPRHPIGVVSTRTDIPADVLRAWERRYGAVVPGRTSTARRLYSDLDVERLRLMKRAVDAGRRISDVARLDLQDLEALVREDLDAAPRTARPTPVKGVGAEDFLDESLAAIRDLDHHRLERCLTTASVALSPARMRQDLIVPLMRSVGDLWRQGELRIAHEHLATSIVRTFLDTVRHGAGPANAPVALVTTPAGQLHELGALLAANTVMEAGWDVVYLGPNLPAEEIAAVCVRKEARVLVLSLVFPPGDPRMHEELRRIRQLIGPDVDIVVGGEAAPSYSEALAEIGARHTAGLDDLRREIETLVQ